MFAYLNILEIQQFQHVGKNRTSTLWIYFQHIEYHFSGGSKTIGISERFYLLNQNVFWTNIKSFWIIDGGWWNLGIWGRSNLREFQKNIMVPPQNTDSHPCTRPPSWGTRVSSPVVSLLISYVIWEVPRHSGRMQGWELVCCGASLYFRLINVRWFPWIPSLSAN